MADNRFYDEQDAEEILRLAARDASSGAMTRERLLATAAELGITEDAINRAEQEMREKRVAEARQRQETQDFREYKRHVRRKLSTSVGNWLGTSIILVGIDYFTTHGITWSFWVVGIWGLAEISGVVKALFTPIVPGPKFEAWRAKRNPAPPIAPNPSEQPQN